MPPPRRPPVLTASPLQRHANHSPPHKRRRGRLRLPSLPYVALSHQRAYPLNAATLSLSLSLERACVAVTEWSNSSTLKVLCDTLSVQHPPPPPPPLLSPPLPPLPSPPSPHSHQPSSPPLPAPHGRLSSQRRTCPSHPAPSIPSPALHKPLTPFPFPASVRPSSARPPPCSPAHAPPPPPPRPRGAAAVRTTAGGARRSTRGGTSSRRRLGAAIRAITGPTSRLLRRLCRCRSRLQGQPPPR